MKLQKLNTRGIVHHFLLAIIVVGVAVGGTLYLVVSKADSCDASGPTSGSVSGAMSDPTSDYDCSPSSGPGSGPTSGPSDVALSCTFTDVPANIRPGESFTPSITMQNNSQRTMNRTEIETNNATIFTGPYTGVDTLLDTDQRRVSGLAAGESKTYQLPTITIPARETFYATTTGNLTGDFTDYTGTTNGCGFAPFTVIIDSPRGVTYNSSNLTGGGTISDSKVSAVVLNNGQTVTPNLKLVASTPGQLATAKLGSSLQVCVTARSTAKTGSLNLSTNFADPKNSRLKVTNFPLTASYVQTCKNIAVGSTLRNVPNSTLSAATPSGTVYIKSITFGQTR